MILIARWRYSDYVKIIEAPYEMTCIGKRKLHIYFLVCSYVTHYKLHMLLKAQICLTKQNQRQWL